MGAGGNCVYFRHVYNIQRNFRFNSAFLIGLDLLSILAYQGIINKKTSPRCHVNGLYLEMSTGHPILYHIAAGSKVHPVCKAATGPVP